MSVVVMIAFIFLSGCHSVTKTTKTAAAPKKPNLLLIIADQWRGQAVGYLHQEPVKTPHLDALAKESLVLTQMVSNFPLCSPARAMLLTGQYPLKNHVYTNVNSASAPDGVELSANAVCWSDVLKSAGYSNGYIGKVHLDSPYPPYIPTSNNKGPVAWNEWTAPERRHGFDYWYAYGTYDEHDRPMYWSTNAKRNAFHYVNEWGPQHEADKALDFFKNTTQQRDATRPFALVVSMNPPHSEYETVPKKYYDIYKDVDIASLTKDPDIPPAGTEWGDFYRKEIKYYYANITGVDEQIGRILQGLQDNGLSDNTLVIVMADHGNCLGKHNEVSKNNIYEESLRIPFVVRWKGQIAPRMDSTFLGSLPDIYPTLLTLMGLNDKIPAGIDGKDYADYWRNGRGGQPQEQYIMGAIMSSQVNINSGFRGLRNKQYKLAYIKEKAGVRPYLFNLEQDPFELHNLYSEIDPTVQAMKKRLLQWLKKTNDTFVIAPQ